jgi:hypothetical protein
MFLAKMKLREIFRVLVIILGMALFLHILITAPQNYEYAWLHMFVNLGIILMNLIGEIIIIYLEKI